MKAEVYKLALEFYLSTKSGPSVNEEAKLQARNILVNGDKRLSGIGAELRKKAQKLADSVIASHCTLLSWDKCHGDTCKFEAYTAKSIKKPSRGAFDATLDVITGGVSIHQAAVAHKVNYQSIKVMKPRIEKYISYAERLKKLSD